MKTYEVVTLSAAKKIGYLTYRASSKECLMEYLRQEGVTVKSLKIR
jgi:hypothetical protein